MNRVEKRFMSHVQKTKGCHIWTGHYSNTTPQFRAGSTGISARRWAYHNYCKRPIPTGGIVTSRCGNLGCVNPKHLVAVSVSQSKKMKMELGINVKGENNGRSKLTGKDVIEIRVLYKEGITQAVLARDYKVSPRLIGMVVRREKWRHI